jgi:hypothetical protein
MTIVEAARTAGRSRRTGRAYVVVAAVAIVTLVLVWNPSTAAGQAAPSPDASAPTPTVQLYMPDGQLKSHSLRVYVTHELREKHNPQLRLLRSHAVTEGTSGEDALRTPSIVSSASGRSPGRWSS